MKIIILLSLIGVTVAGGVFAYLYLSSSRNITFDIQQPNVTVEIYKGTDTEKPIKTVDTTTVVSLRDGEYYYVVSGDRYEETTENLLVDSDLSIAINPNYSREYLASLLDPQEKAIHNIISTTYADIINQYDIHPGELFNRGEWYGTVITKKVADERQITDPYRIILLKENDTWRIVEQPEIVVTTTNQPTVPIDILRLINNLQPS